MTKKHLTAFRRELVGLLKRYDVQIAPLSHIDFEVVQGYRAPIVLAVDWKKTRKTGEFTRVRI